MGKSNAQKILDLMYDNLFHGEGERIIFFSIDKASQNGKDKETVYLDVWPNWIIDNEQIEEWNGILPINNFANRCEFEIPYKEPVQYCSSDKYYDKRNFNVKLLDVLQKAFGEKNGQT